MGPDGSDERTSHLETDETSNNDEQAEMVELGTLYLHEEKGPKLKGPRRLEDTRARLAYALILLIGLVILGLFLLLAAQRIDSDEFEKLAAVMLAPLVGLLGAATGYYYGRTSKP